MIRHLITVSGAQFVYDDQTVIKRTDSNNMVATFVLLRAEKILRIATQKKTGEHYESTTYEYTSQLFRDLPMCHKTDIVSDQPANAILIELFTAVSNKDSLSKDLKELLRENYLQIIDLREQ